MSATNLPGGNTTGATPILINLETLRLQLTRTVSRVLSRVSADTLRPLPQFLGLDAGAGFCFAPTAYQAPVKKVDKTALEKLRRRVSLNMAFFISNYALLAAFTAGIISLLHPGMVLTVGMVYALWMFHGFLLRHQLVVFGLEVHRLLSVQQRFYILFVLTSIVVVWKCLKPTLLFVSITSAFVLFHAVLRDPKDVELRGTGVDDDDDEDDLEGGSGHHSSDGSTSEVLVERPGRGKSKK